MQKNKLMAFIVKKLKGFDATNGRDGKMSKQKHTLGPWRVGKNGRRIYCKYGHIADVHGVDNILGGTMEANARLIASAPDLLAACKRSIAPLLYLRNKGSECDSDVGYVCDLCKLITQILTVIAKIEGDKQTEADNAK